MRYFLFLLFLFPAFAQEPSTVRLTKRGSAVGIEIALQAGYKTYWRYVGDSGIPPVFKWEGSQNLKSVQVHYPTPLKFSDGFGFAIGYKETVFFPLEIELFDTLKPVQLKLQLEYAVCDKICLPASATVTASFKDISKFDLTDKSLNLPQKKNGLAEFISQDEKQIIFSIIASQEQEILVEGMSDAWALPFPKLLKQDGDKAIYTLKKEGQPRGESFKGAQLRLTILSKQASETTLSLP